MGRRGRKALSAESLFFVTTTVVPFAPIFENRSYCDILVSNIRHYQKEYGFRIYAYVIMPSHFHWIVDVDPKRGTISDIMRDVKKFSAWDIMDAVGQNNEPRLLRLFHVEAKKVPGQRRKFWMRRFDDEVIRNEGMLRTKTEYIHNNPVKAGLVARPEDYIYSSARNYSHSGKHVLDVVTDWF